MKPYLLLLLATIITTGCATTQQDSGAPQIGIDRDGSIQVSDSFRHYRGQYVPIEQIATELTAAGAEPADIITVVYSATRVDKRKVQSVLHALVDAGYFNFWTLPK